MLFFCVREVVEDFVETENQIFPQSRIPKRMDEVIVKPPKASFQECVKVVNSIPQFFGRIARSVLVKGTAGKRKRIVTCLFFFKKNVEQVLRTTVVLLSSSCAPFLLFTNIVDMF